MNEQKLWEDCVSFHGHACGGLTIGYKAALYAMELLGLSRSEDESVVCITENDACGVDAIQVILGCSIGKGNLLFHLRGKQAFSFYERSSGRSVRLVLRPTPEGLDKEARFRYLQDTDPADLFDVKPTTLALPDLELDALYSADPERTRQLVAERWEELRETVFRLDRLEESFRTEQEVLTSSGAWARDYRLWGEDGAYKGLSEHRSLGLEETLEFMEQRLAFLDEYMADYTPADREAFDVLPK